MPDWRENIPVGWPDRQWWGDIFLSQKNIRQTAENGAHDICDVFSSRRHHDTFHIAPILQQYQDATPQELFSAIQSHLQTFEDINEEKQIQNMRTIMDKFTNKEQELFWKVCKRVISGEYNDSRRSDTNHNDPLSSIADVMFKFGEKMPDNFFNLATEIKVNRVGRAYFVIDSDDLNHRFTLKNMIRYFKDEKLLWETWQFHFWDKIQFDEDTIQFICKELKDMNPCYLQFYNSECLDDTCIELLKQFQQEQESKGKRVYLYILGKVDAK